jgi:predicted transcriptional regulator of viral defense system
MNWIDFKSKLFDLGCFSIHQVYAWQPGFDRNNVVRWTRRGYLVRLRQGLYAFAEYKDKPDSAMYFAGKIYSPSYISLHSALSVYGLIPESVVQITGVTSRKTAAFRNAFGEYSYKSVRDDLMFGYVLRPLVGGRVTSFATMEKALLDLLYLYPFYSTEKELAGLRLDGEVLRQDLDRAQLEAVAARFHCSRLERRVRLLRKVYDL